MNKEYFNETEQTDWEKLVLLNDTIKAFESITQMPEKHYFDASGITKDGREAIIELKTRKAILTDDFRASSSTFISDDLFIEDHKASDILFEAISLNSEPLYINFLEDGHTIIFNLLRTKRRPKRHKNILIKSEGYQRMEFANRQGLYISDSAIYDKAGNLVHKPL